MKTVIFFPPAYTGERPRRMQLPDAAADALVVAGVAAAPIVLPSDVPIVVTPPVTLPSISLSASISKAEGNSGANLYRYTVSLSAVAAAIVNVPWSFLAGTTSPDDFTGGVYPAGGMVQIPAGQLTGTIDVSVNGDTVVEGDETFTVLISTPAGYIAGAATSATGTIVNDDTAPTPGPVSAPASFTAAGDVIPFTITRASNGIFSTNYNADTVKPAYARTIYVKKAGAINNDGLTEATAINSISAAIGIANSFTDTSRIVIEGNAAGSNAIRFCRKDGTVTRTATPGNAAYKTAWGGTAAALDASVVIEPLVAGTTWISMFEEVFSTPTFVATADANVWVATYTTSEFPGHLIFDWNNPDVDGIPRLIAPYLPATAPSAVADIIAGVNATWAQFNAVKDKPTDSGSYGLGASYLDMANRKIYVRTFNNRQPVLNTDIDCLVRGSNPTDYPGAQTKERVTAARTIWMRGGMLMGGYNGALYLAPAAGKPITFYGDLMRYVGGFGNGAFSVNPDETAANGGGTYISSNSTTAYATLDGWNVHGNSSTGAAGTLANNPFQIEINCKSRLCGWSSPLVGATNGFNNGTTAHGKVRKLSVNGEYLNSQDITCHDVGNSLSWYLAPVASTRRTADATRPNRVFMSAQDTSTGVQTMWIDTATPVAGMFGAPVAYYDAYGPGAQGGTINFGPNMNVPPGPINGGTFASYTA